MSEVLLLGIWYGEVSQLSLDELKNSLLSVQDERECILLIVEIMKKGDFSVKNLLIDLMNQTEDEAVLNLCIRLFCSVCTNDDLKDVNNFRFLDSVEVGNLYTDVVKTKNLDCYYYNTSLAFPGLFTQEIMTALYVAAQKKEKYHLYLQSSLLSIYSGEKVPVDTNVVISRDEIDLMISYIDRLIKKHWVEGMKYFYGHPVEN